MLLILKCLEYFELIDYSIISSIIYKLFEATVIVAIAISLLYIYI